jgi:hypothetical protein
MNTPTPPIGRYFLFVKRETGAVLGKAQVLSHLHDTYYWIRVFDVDDAAWQSVYDLESMIDLPFFDTEGELEHFLAFQCNCEHNHDKEKGH